MNKARRQNLSSKRSRTLFYLLLFPQFLWKCWHRWIYEFPQRTQCFPKYREDSLFRTSRCLWHQTHADKFMPHSALATFQTKVLTGRTSSSSSLRRAWCSGVALLCDTLGIVRGQGPVVTAQLEEKGLQTLCASLTVLLNVTNQNGSLQRTAQKFTGTA